MGTVLKEGEKVSLYSSATSMALSAVKALTGWYTGSVALMADAVNSFSDIFASLAVYFGLKLSQKKATRQFPYGYYKAETLASLTVSVIIVLAGVEILLESARTFLTPGEVVMAPYALVVVSISAAAYFVMARYKVTIGKKIQSPALISDGKHSLIDVASSGLVFSGILLSHIGYPRLEPVAGFVVGVFIIKMGVTLGRYAVLVLLDACVNPDLIKKTRLIAEQVPGVEGVHHLKLRRSGPYAFGEMHLETKGTLTVAEAHTISDTVEKRIKKEIPEIDSITVHIEPRKGPLKMCTVAVPVENDKGLHSDMSSHLGKAPFFLVATVEEGAITKWDLVENPAAHLEKKRGVKAAEFLKEMGADIVVTGEVGTGSQYTLTAEHIAVKSPEGDTIEEVILRAAGE
jgi:cation diffusion facilitator family transporter